MSGVVRKKQDDKYLAALRELVNTGGGNRQCFDCGQKGPTYVNMTIGSFVCTRCSGVLRGLTPPHRVKSISMATFTQDEIDFLKAHGNDDCAKTWLGLWDPKRAVHQDHRELMIDKYERKRYYLEPASPLKSLTNAASLKAAAAVAPNQNGSSTFTNGGHNKPLDNGFNGIQLTPPTSQRNGMQQHKSSSSAISRPQHHHQQQQDAFMVNNNNNNNNTNNNNNNNMMNGFHNHHHHHQLSYSGSAGSTSTGALSDTSSCASNGFGPETDFVADFGSANIFDATSASSVGSPAVSSASSVASSNGYAKIQPIKAAQQQQQKQQQHQQQQQQFVNGHANGQLNGTSSLAAVMNGNTENFADFDHAPIYNAAGAMPIPNGNRKTSFSSISSSSNNNNNNNNNNTKLSSTPSEDRYAALKDLDEQLRESKAVAAAAASVVGSAVLESFGNNNNSLSLPNGVNPFKSQQQQQPNPFQMSSQHHHLQAQPNANHLYGQLTIIPTANGVGSAPATNGFGGIHQAPTAFFNYSNGFTSTAQQQQQQQHPTIVAGGPSGCGFGFGAAMQQQMTASGGVGGTVNGVGGVIGAYVNPFATSGAVNTNNPFL